MGPAAQALLLAILTVGCLLPFVQKAFHVDDTLFLYAARQILADPLDPFGFDVNWYGSPTPMSGVTKNPPGASYWIAAFAAAFGFREAPLHVAFMLPALAVVLGTFVLARRLTPAPFLAGLVTLLSPFFLVSSTTVMSDVLMLAFWVWAVVFWERGIREGRGAALFLAGALIGMGVLTKYYAAALVPLLGFYALQKRRSLGVWVAALALPVAIMAGYEIVTGRLYGRGLFLDAMTFSQAIKGSELAGSRLGTVLVGLAFLGAGCAPVVPFGLLGLRARWIAPAVGGLVLFGVVIFVSPPTTAGPFPWARLSGSVVVQLFVWSFVGLVVLALAAVDRMRDRSPEATMLALWTLGTFVFAAFLNWTVNARTVLPIVPAAALLTARRLAPVPAPAARPSRGRKPSRRRFVAPAAAGAASAIIAFAAAWADFGLANSARTAVTEVGAELDRRPAGREAKIHFQGHWGFQYYAERAGMLAMHVDDPGAGPGDRVVLAGNNTCVYGVGAGSARPLARIDVPVPGWITTMSSACGAGFYSDHFGPLPFALGRVPEVPYLLLEVTDSERLAPPSFTVDADAG
jgi:4-amino-4-deoxy-L-arabinose transferase-like glycosyltransferase